MVLFKNVDIMMKVQIIDFYIIVLIFLFFKDIVKSFFFFDVFGIFFELFDRECLGEEICIGEKLNEMYL